MATRTLVHEVTKGSLRETEDWWYLVVEDNGTTYIEHEWSHVDPYGKRPPNSGTKKIPVDEFLAGDHSQGAKDSLREALKKK